MLASHLVLELRAARCFFPRAQQRVQAMAVPSNSQAEPQLRAPPALSKWRRQTAQVLEQVVISP